MHGLTLLGCVERIQKSGSSDFHLMGFMKDQMQGQQYVTSDAVQEAVCHGVRTTEMEFCFKRFLRLPEGWQKNVSIVMGIR
jgi:hypothetical protein